MSTEELIESLGVVLQAHAELCASGGVPADVVAAVEVVRDLVQRYEASLMAQTGWSAPIGLKARTEQEDTGRDDDEFSPYAPEGLEEAGLPDGPKVERHHSFVAELRYYLQVRDPRAFSQQLAGVQKMRTTQVVGALVRLFRENDWQPRLSGLSVDGIGIDVWLEED